MTVLQQQPFEMMQKENTDFICTAQELWTGFDDMV